MRLPASTSVENILCRYPMISKGDHTRILALLHKLRSPHLRLPPTIHIAGTNGKGSTLALLHAFLKASQKRVHIYTSPHLMRVNERIVVAGHEISDDELFVTLQRCDKVAVRGTTWFELLTAAAFLIFSEAAADYVLLETGLGGRLDATNIIPNPLLTLITSISYDHMEQLGPHLTGIAFEKAGILKSGCPLIIPCHSNKIRDIILSQAAALNCPVLEEGFQWSIQEQNDKIIYQWQETSYDLPKPALVGNHQIQNAGIALTAGFYLKLSLSSLSIGLKNVQWRGRLQRLPSTFPQEVWLDGAHNSGGAEAILKTLLQWQKRDGLPLYMIVGMTAHKDYESFLKVFKNHVTHLFVIPLKNKYQYLDPQVLYLIAQKYDIPVSLFSHFSEALKAALRHNPLRLLICGSLYLVGEVLEDYSSLLKSFNLELNNGK